MVRFLLEERLSEDRFGVNTSVPELMQDISGQGLPSILASLTLLQSKIGCILLWNFDAKMPNVCWNTNEAIKGYKRMKGLSYCKHMYIMIITMQFYCISQLLGKINVSKPNVDHPLGFHNGTFLD